MVKTIAALVVSLSVTGGLWYVTEKQLAANAQLSTAHIEYVQRHQNDALRTMICYFEERTIKSRQLSPAQRLRGIQTLEHSLRVAHLTPCEIDF